LGRSASLWDWARTLTLSLGALALAWFAWSDTSKLLRTQPLGIDFLPMWAGAHEALFHPSKLYDFAGVTHFVRPLLAPFHGLRPFVYPPPALFLFAPFALAPFWVANAVWTLAGLALILAAVAPRLHAPRGAALAAMLLTPGSVLVVATGQITFLIAAAGVTALYALPRRPVVAGALLGLAAMVKPQALALAPLALLATQQWRALAAAAAAASLAVLASALAFGFDAWTHWLVAVGRFEHIFMALPGFQKGMITPTALGIFLKLDPGALATWRLAFAIGGAAMVWGVFRKTDDPARRLTALFGGALFVTPYAMHYDAALLAPGAALMLANRTRPGPWIASVAAGALLCCAAIPHWGSAAVTAFVLVAALLPESAFAGRIRLAPTAAPLGGEAPG
jgi:hypothetical protein